MIEHMTKIKQNVDSLPKYNTRKNISSFQCED